MTKITRSGMASFVVALLGGVTLLQAQDALQMPTPVKEHEWLQWTMTGKNNFMAKAFALFMKMDKRVGGDFEKGLAQLKTVLEAAPKKECGGFHSPNQRKILR